MSYATFHKEIARTITGSLGRFIAIFAIVALGVGFYSGLMMTAPDMQRAADAFYDDARLMDIRVVSTLGMTDDDIEALRAIDGVDAVVGAKEADVVADIGGDPYAVRAHSLADSALASLQAASGDEPLDDVLNRPYLAEGRWPTAPNECVVSADRVMGTPVVPGDALTMTQGTGELSDVFSETRYTIVGLVHAPYYTSSATMDSTSLGSGRIEQFMYVPEGAFSADYPMVEAYVTVAGARELDGSSAAYDQRVGAVQERIEAIAGEREQARLDGLKADAQDELDRARSDYLAERADAEGELACAKEELEQAEREIATNEAKVQQGQADLARGEAELASMSGQAAERFSQAQTEIDAKAGELAASEQDWQARSQAFEEVKDALPPEEAKQTEAALAAAKAQIDEGKAAVVDAERALDAERASAQDRIAAAQQTLDASRGQLSQATSQLERGRADLAQGRADYEQARAEADARFADAEAELAQAQADIDAIERPEWLVMDRTKNYGAESFAQDALRIQSIAQVFPLIFFLVAALVALTTMTRMVEDERMLIGTYKALGYSRGRISSKYLAYALAASLGGAVVGIAALSFTLPAIIMNAYAIVYIVPIGSLALDWPIVCGAALAGVGITLAATEAALASTLRETPAVLMLPKAPKSGKRILLERVRPIWGRLSFLWKVTCRNLFRYKKRMAMTTVGIAGCTALLLTGFGLHDSINDIIDTHYGEIVRYNTTIVLEDDASASDAEALEEVLRDQGAVGARAASNERNVVALSGDEERTVPLIVPTDVEAYGEVREFRDRATGEPRALDGSGALLTEKLGVLLGVGPGDEIEVAETTSTGEASGVRVRVPVSALVENYVGNAVFMAPDYYESVYGEPAADGEVGYNTLVVMSGLDEAGRSSLSDSVRAIPGVKTIGYNDEVIETYRTSLRSVNMIVYVLIVAATLLAFIVLYNLININITERVREIATLKVLGFTPREVQRYMFREIYLLAGLGALIGLVLGVVLENFVVVTAEVDAVMFGRAIHGASFALAFVLTMLFTWIVTLLMRRKLDRIDMVESLKSNE